LAAILAVPFFAQAPPSPDVLILTDGEKLMGQFVKATGGSLSFKSAALGVVTVDWSEVKELQSTQRVAVIPKNVTLRLPRDAAKATRGTVSMADRRLQISGAQPVPLADVGNVVDDSEFQKALEHKDGLLHDWKGALTGGAALVEATQDTRTFNGSVNLMKQEPADDWLVPRDRTSVNFNAVYGKQTQPGTPEAITSIYHADGERDEYFNPRWFGFGRVAFDHNFGQGLHLEQDYGGGVGWIALKNGNEELDVKGSGSYIRQGLNGLPANNLAGATAAETFNRKLAHGMIVDEQLSFVGALNKPSAYSTQGGIRLTMPVYRRLSFTTGTEDSFLNDPPPGFRKNSFQFTAGATYTLK